MPNPELVQVISKGFKEGLPHPGDRENHQTNFIIRIPGMNPQGLPRQVLDYMAKDAGMPSSDMSMLAAEAVINLIETEGDSEIIKKSQLEEWREYAEQHANCSLNSGANADVEEPVDVISSDSGD